MLGTSPEAANASVVNGIAIGVSTGVILMTVGGVVRLWRRDIEREKDVEQLKERTQRVELAIEKIPEAMEKVADSFRDGFRELHTTLQQQGEALAYLRGRAEERDSGPKL